MYRNDLVQSALISYLKSNTTILNELPASGSEEIREDQWQGTNFMYPNIRVRIISNIPYKASCDASEISVGIQVYSEESSSWQADRIAGIINSVLHTRSFYSSGIHFNMYTTNLVPAIRRDTRTWQSEVLMRGTISG